MFNDGDEEMLVLETENHSEMKEKSRKSSKLLELKNKEIMYKTQGKMNMAIPNFDKIGFFSTNQETTGRTNFN